jgi:hypothetical protein
MAGPLMGCGRIHPVAPAQQWVSPAVLTPYTYGTFPADTTPARTMPPAGWLTQRARRKKVRRLW